MPVLLRTRWPEAICGPLVGGKFACIWLTVRRRAAVASRRSPSQPRLLKPETFRSTTPCSSSYELRPTVGRIDALSVKTGFDIQTYRANHFLESFIGEGRICEARRLFDEMPLRNTFTINRMMSGYVSSGQLDEARLLFDGMTNRSTITWTIMIGAFSQSDQPDEALCAFRSMLATRIRPDHVTIIALLSSCNVSEMSGCLMQIHSLVVKLGFKNVLRVCNTLVDSYCKCGLVRLGRKVFDEMQETDSVTYNAMLMGCSKEGFHYDALELFFRMQDLGLTPSQYTFSGVLTATTGLADFGLGQQVYGLVIKTNFSCNVFVCNSLLDFYSKSDCLHEAMILFKEMPERDNVSYNVMISCYAWNAQTEHLFKLLKEMQYAGFDRKHFPFPSLLSFAGSLPHIGIGRQIHAQTIVTKSVAHDDLVSNALIDMYSKCGVLSLAKMIFKSKKTKNTISWTAMISGYVENGLYEDALWLFCEMRRADMKPDRATFSTILRASASLALLSLGQQLHCYMIRYGYMSNVFSGSALLDMYAKCGCLDETLKTFQDMPKRNMVSWNAMISAYAQNGHGKKAIKLFEDMLSCGLEPDSVTILSVLVACSHSGLVEEGLQFFNSMSKIYGLKPRKEHYACAIDMLGRIGRFDEVEGLVNSIPYEADQIIWNSILNSCRIYGNEELARRAADKLFEMGVKDASPFVIMSNVYARAGHWDEFAKVMKMMRGRGIKKEPAYSWVEIKKRIYTFSSNDKRNPQISQIRALLKELSKKMKKEGYQPDTGCALHQLDEQDKIESLWHHSERLAIAFALLNSPDGAPIRVMKNLRACTDCHEAIKVMTKIVQREIIVRDSSRFHHFKNGTCSCGDYW